MRADTEQEATRTTPQLEAYVAALPELYQPIYRHPELSNGAARTCHDRAEVLAKAYRAFSTLLGRPLRVLDLGCSQGYFSLAMAHLGARVIGIDHQPANIELCNALARENPQYDVQFLVGSIEHIDTMFDLTQFDLVLGLSVFHHLIVHNGAERVSSFLDVIATKVGAALYEFALPLEPVEWATYQPSDVRSLIQKQSFTRLLGKFPTHLSQHSRPLFWASNRYLYLDDTIIRFDTVRNEAHPFSEGYFSESRRYYFSDHLIIKVFSVNGALSAINRQELQREADFIRDHGAVFCPGVQIHAYGGDQHHRWLARTLKPGTLVSEAILEQHEYDADRLILDLLQQLCVLEERGLYHTDLQTWNMLLQPDGSAHIIDYGAICATPQSASWPQNLFIGFFAVVWQLTQHQCDRLVPMISPFHLPDRYQAWARRLWEIPPASWSFALFLNELRATPAETVEPALTAQELWMREIERHLLEKIAVNRDIRHATEKICKLQYEQALLLRSIATQYPKAR